MNKEEKKNKLNLEIRELVSIIGMIDGIQKTYDDYEVDSLNDEMFLDKQISIVEDAKKRLINVFKD